MIMNLSNVTPIAWLLTYLFVLFVWTTGLGAALKLLGALLLSWGWVFAPLIAWALMMVAYMCLRGFARRTKDNK